MDFQKFDDKRAINNYGSLLLVKEASEQLYSLLLPLETTPSVFGSVDTFDFDLLSSKTKGKVEGKETLDSKDVEFMWHRDNLYRLEGLVGKMLDFLVIKKDFSGYAFSGTIRIRPNDNSAEISKGTFTITPISAVPTPILDCRDLYKDTVVFANTIPDTLTIGSTDEVVSIATSPAGETVTIEASCDNSNFDVQVSQASGSTLATVTIKKKADSPDPAPQYGIVYITAKADNYASWTTTIAVDYAE